jgi:Cu-processing system ATP-binding protein
MVAHEAGGREGGMIRVEHLSKRFGKARAVDEVSFTVHEGEVFAFLGPNGSGKTTTMKSIVGLVIPTSGTIRINGIDVHRHPRSARRMMSYLPQRVVLPESLTAREILVFHARLRGLAATDGERMLEKGRFAGAANRPVGTFSGGMVQRLGLAVVTLPDSPVLLLDEPTANLDPQGVKRFREFIMQQKEAGKTIIFSTHLLAEAEQLADRVGIFVGGRLVAEESVESLRAVSRAARTIEDLYLHYVGGDGDEV